MRVIIVGLVVCATICTFAYSYTLDNLSVGKARELLQHIAGANLKKDQVTILDIKSGVGGDAIVEARLDTSFRLQAKDGHWDIAEVRFGDRQWESFELIEEGVRREKIRRTTLLLNSIANGLKAYKEDRGQYVDTNKISDLLDFLSPRYMRVPPSFDLWGEHIEYRGKPDRYRLISAGPDRKQGTKDDIVLENGSLRNIE